ncbi:MAG TPA: hypothetical protein VFE62_00635 [Gemmataceae bacterium]|nr:hypothetical protein [Gemmataceae bacterium]
MHEDITLRENCLHAISFASVEGSSQEAKLLDCVIGFVSGIEAEIENAQDNQDDDQERLNEAANHGGS